jgi:hypothetical protein
MAGGRYGGGAGPRHLPSTLKSGSAKACMVAGGPGCVGASKGDANEAMQSDVTVAPCVREGRVGASTSSMSSRAGTTPKTPCSSSIHHVLIAALLALLRRALLALLCDGTPTRHELHQDSGARRSCIRPLSPWRAKSAPDK